MDENFKPYLLEINDHPSLKAPSPLDKVIKAGVMRTTFALLDPDRDPIKFRKIDFYSPKRNPSAAEKKDQNDGNTSTREAASVASSTDSQGEGPAIDGKASPAGPNGRVGRIEMDFLTIEPEKRYRDVMPEMFTEAKDRVQTNDEIEEI
eukprot:CAMPEP_0114513122 /NCGR_PEP_ID=MMETSP0109-20121206/15379_1 /TAXON_ID=29199 /ORGANISM="Chlorarachnion reptans, Strain CCCM449" /LENGTH=148 /DNA_ID=CAMNT_0001692929 /DNA_START=82 /DNA_END=528 /DNA_ORIENTATION=+